MRDSIIQIPIWSSSNEIKNIVVVSIPLQLTLGHVVKRHRDHVRSLHDLSNSTTLAQKIVASSVFSVTEIIIIEYRKLYRTFLHVAFES
jgi:inner membrane protein involved in colicin E2 resistance